VLPVRVVAVRRALVLDLLVGLLTLGWLLVSRAAAAEDLPELAERIKPSVVHLVVLDATGSELGSGTGFFVEGHRIVTNQHVIASASRMLAKLADGRQIEVAGILAADADRDLAILAIEGDDLPPPLPLGDSGHLRQGDPVVVIGSPRGLSGTLSTGVVAALRGGGVESEIEAARGTRSWAIQITAAVSPGSSGSPILTSNDGQVVAVAVGLIGGNLGFGIPIENAKTMLEGIAPDAEPMPFGAVEGSELKRNLMISGAFFLAIALAFFVPGWISRARKKRKS
jgi:S1-C subfamily serine protease